MTSRTAAFGANVNQGTFGNPYEVITGDAETGTCPLPEKSCPTRRPMKTLAELVHEQNGWYTALAVLCEFLGVVFIGLATQFARGMSDAGVSALTIGAVYCGSFFFFSSIAAPIHVNPLHTILYMFTFAESIWRGVLRIVAQALGFLTAAGLSKLILDSNYINTRLVVNSAAGFSAFEGFFVETLGETIFALIALQLFFHNVRGVSIPSASIILGITVAGFQGMGFPFTGASFNVFRWLFVNAIGWHTPYWPGSWWIYPVAALAGGAIAIGIHFLLKKILEQAQIEKEIKST